MYRRRSKYTFRRNNRRRRFSNSKFRIRKRIFRRALSRRPVRPEVKYINSNTNNALATNGIVSITASATSIGSGVGANQKIGQEIRIRRVKVRMQLTNNSGQTGVTAPIRHTGKVRFIFWTPRINYEQAAAYMNGISMLSIPDWNTVTVHVDRTITLAPSYLDQEVGVNGVISAGGAAPYEYIFMKTFPFPRRAKFGGGLSELHPDKDVLYCTIINGDLATAYAIVSKTTYVDN